MPRINIKDKLKKISALFVVCLIVTLSVTLPTPLKANAAEDNTNKYLYIIGTIAAYAGIDIDVDEVASRFSNFVDDVMDLAKDIYDELAEEYGWTNDTTSGGGGGGRHRDGVIAAAEDLEDYLDYLSRSLYPLNPSALGVNYKFILCLVRAISEWCDEHLNSYVAPAGSVNGSVFVPSGNIDVYTARSLQFVFPSFSGNDNVLLNFAVNNCVFSYHFNPTVSEYNFSTCLSAVSAKNFFTLTPLNYDFTFVYSDLSGISVSRFSGATVYNKPFSYSYDNSGQFRASFSFSTNPDGGPNSWNLSGFYIDQSRDYSYFVSGGKRYRLSGSRGQNFYFVNMSDSTDIYNNLTFDSGFSALCWFFDLCGINIRTGSTSSYVQVDTEPAPIIIDDSVYNQTISDITNIITNNNYQEGDTVTMVFPSYYTTNNYYNYDDYRQHPEYILDFNQDGLLNSDFNMPSYDGNVLATKFPFCIPFDCYNLVANLVVTPEAPQFHWLVLPANSFGLGNDDFYIDLDFTPYNFLVQLMRFFIAAGFVVWLMTKTKDLMQ